MEKCSNTFFFGVWMVFKNADVTASAYTYTLQFSNGQKCSRTLITMAADQVVAFYLEMSNLIIFFFTSFCSFILLSLLLRRLRESLIIYNIQYTIIVLACLC